ncbi:MAG TPA: DUF6283 family protein [Ramlibacter sp.]|nr:DUF6283 family protein [Ramlibacter sp.]
MSAVKPGFALVIQCDECPWRRDVPTGNFPPERYAALANSCRQGYPPAPMFACHKTPEGKEQACVGYLLRNGTNNIAVRIAAAEGRVKLRALQVRGPLYDGFRAMAVANGYDPGDDSDLA